MAIYTFRTSTYARNIYIFGNTTFEYVAGVAPEYVTPIKQHAAANYTKAQIDQALANKYINQAEYDETISYIVPPVTDPAAPTTTSEEATV